MLRFDVWNSYYEPHFTVDFIYLFSVSDLKIYKLPSRCFLFLLRWNTHTHTSVKLHWDMEYHNPNNPVQVNCWERKGLHWWFPIHPLLQLPRVSILAGLPLCRAFVPVKWSVFSHGSPKLQPTSSAEHPRHECFPASLLRGHEALHNQLPTCQRVLQLPN